MLTTSTYRFINLAPVQRKNVKYFHPYQFPYHSQSLPFLFPADPNRYPHGLQQIHCYFGIL